MTDNRFPSDPVAHSNAIESIREEQADAFTENPELQNSMVYWYPVLREAVTNIPRIQTPDTLFVDLTPLNIYEIANERDDVSDAELEELAQCPAEWDAEQVQRAVDYIGYPAFIRTDTDSDKHNIEDAGRISSSDISHIDTTVDQLIRGAAGHSGMMGAPRFNFFAVREWININSSFTAFDGTPIGPEVRVFARNGNVECHHFYWPFNKDRMVNAVDGEYDLDAELQVEEMQVRIGCAMDDFLRDAAAEISTYFDGYWSIDFAYTESGDWYAIDMARGDDSWHPERCEHVETTPTDDEMSITAEAEELLEDMGE